MIPFDLRVEWKNGILWISEEDGSGCRYRCQTPSQVANFVEKYIEAREIELEAENGN